MILGMMRPLNKFYSLRIECILRLDVKDNKMVNGSGASLFVVFFWSFLTFVYYDTEARHADGMIMLAENSLVNEWSENMNGIAAG